jgi:predicted glycosyltransferase
MSNRPRLLFYCQHSLGMGHLIRSFAIANGLTNDFDVVFLNGGPLPEGQKSPERVEIINLPPLGFDSEMQLLSRDDNHTVEQAQRRRAEIMRKALCSARPEVLLIELFPFGRKKFAGELVKLLEDARTLSRPPLVVCSLRDILVERNQHHDELACHRANRYFDAVLVHSDAQFARLEESFHPYSPLKVPVHYTGFVTRGQTESAVPELRREPRIVVSAGGGMVGEVLLRTAMQAYELLRVADKPEMRVIGGPFIPERSWQALEKIVRATPGVSSVRSVPDLGAELRAAAASISQCGYNTAMDLLRSRAPALVVPFSGEKQDEQMNRARRLERMGALRVLEPERFNAQTLATEMEALLQFRPAPIQLDMGGVENTAQLLKELLRQRRQTRAANYSEEHTGATPDWLLPVRETLDGLAHPASLFFRDDDCGWGDDRLLLLLDIFTDFGIPVDLAAIPAALHAALAQKLSRRMAAHPERLRVHQHGYAHVNHEPNGKKCEFGPARDYLSQRSDIESGQRRLAELLGTATAPDPIFTPPWNRCTPMTARCLAELGFQVLSRDSHAEALGISGLFEMPIAVDWFAHRKKVRLDRKEWGRLLAAEIESEDPVGIMLHHAVMDADEMQAFAQLLSLLARHSNANCQTMQSLAAAQISNLLA